MNWKDAWNRHKGARFAIIGNGWSLNDVPRESLPDDMVVIGVNRAWRWGRLDYWVGIDRPVYADTLEFGFEDMIEWGTVAIAHKRYQDKPGRKFPPPPIPTLWIGRPFKMRSALLPEDITEESLGDDSTPLWAAGSSVDRAIHSALIMGASELHLYGCDLQNKGDERGERRFCTNDNDIGLRTASGIEQLRRNAEFLEKFARAWAGQPLGLHIHSPSERAKGLQGWEHSW